MYTMHLTVDVEMPIHLTTGYPCIDSKKMALTVFSIFIHSSSPFALFYLEVTEGNMVDSKIMQRNENEEKPIYTQSLTIKKRKS